MWFKKATGIKDVLQLNLDYIDKLIVITLMEYDNALCIDELCHYINASEKTIYTARKRLIEYNIIRIDKRIIILQPNFVNKYKKASK